MKIKRTIQLLSLVAAIMLLAACTTQPTGNVVQQIPVQAPIVIPTIVLTSYPDTVEAGDFASITWNLDSSSSLTAIHTAIHYDVASHPGTLGLDIGPSQGGYPTLTTDYASGSFVVPGDFAAKITIPAGATQLFFRAHAIINGNNYWTDEYSIKINSFAETITPATPSPDVTPIMRSGVPVNAEDYESFTVVADDKSINPSIISVNTNELVAIKFKVRPTDVASGALQFNIMAREILWGSTKDIPAGAEKTIYFQAPDQPRIISYGVYSATGGNLLQIGYINVITPGSTPLTSAQIISNANSGSSGSSGSSGGSSGGIGY